MRLRKGRESRPEERRRREAGGGALGEGRDQGQGGDILVIARTDSRMATNPEIEDNFKEAILRCFEFKQLGADAVWAEGPRSGAEMEAFNVAMEGTRTILAQVERPGVEMLSPGRCAELGYDVALYGLTLLSASAAAIERAARVMGRGDQDHPTSKQRAEVMESGAGLLMPFDDLYDAVGFNEHYDLEDAFDGDKFACAEDPGAAECAADLARTNRPGRARARARAQLDGRGERLLRIRFRRQEGAGRPVQAVLRSTASQERRRGRLLRGHRLSRAGGRGSRRV